MESQRILANYTFDTPTTFWECNDSLGIGKWCPKAYSNSSKFEIETPDDKMSNTIFNEYSLEQSVGCVEIFLYIYAMQPLSPSFFNFSKCITDKITELEGYESRGYIFAI